MLINSAGTGDFGLLDQVNDAALEQMFAINVLAPMQLFRELLPHLRGQPAAAILNVGSVFGIGGYPGFTAFRYQVCSSGSRKRSGVVLDTRCAPLPAPRATRTNMNAAAVERMNAELKVAMDTPQSVAIAACDMLQNIGASSAGWPENYSSSTRCCRESWMARCRGNCPPSGAMPWRPRCRASSPRAIFQQRH
jgi:hypothetical protein